MIPYQELHNRRSEPVPFLSWIDSEEMVGLSFTSYQETYLQLIDTFYSVAISYGLRLPKEIIDLVSFRKQCFQTGQALAVPPRLYLKCSDAETSKYLVFNWEIWLRESQFILSLESK
jgi:hypothetical protein